MATVHRFPERTWASVLRAQIHAALEGRMASVEIEALAERCCARLERYYRVYTVRWPPVSAALLALPEPLKEEIRAYAEATARDAVLELRRQATGDIFELELRALGFGLPPAA